MDPMGLIKKLGFAWPRCSEKKSENIFPHMVVRLMVMNPMVESAKIDQLNKSKEGLKIDAG